jgi:hypothetical protein
MPVGFNMGFIKEIEWFFYTAAISSCTGSTHRCINLVAFSRHLKLEAASQMHKRRDNGTSNTGYILDTVRYIFES